MFKFLCIFLIQLISFYDQNETSGRNQSVRRMNVSDWTGPVIAQVNGSYGMSRYSSAGSGYAWGSAGYTLPIMRSVTSAERLHRSLNYHNSAFSEFPRKAQIFVPGYFTTRQLPSRVLNEDNGDDVFLPDNLLVNTQRSEQQMMSWERQKVPTAYSQQDEMVWGTQNISVGRDIRDRQKILRTQPSQASSLISMHLNNVAEVKVQEWAGHSGK